ncbi:MAG: hypothetical protein J3K34DRAFT_526789 [Monoraphidium minutum]|nr:MAG: hypothetical protein J3K34DRAFT_526789 [Monoraphidium minutum]
MVSSFTAGQSPPPVATSSETVRARVLVLFEFSAPSLTLDLVPASCRIRRSADTGRNQNYLKSDRCFAPRSRCTARAPPRRQPPRAAGADGAPPAVWDVVEYIEPPRAAAGAGAAAAAAAAAAGAAARRVRLGIVAGARGDGALLVEPLVIDGGGDGDDDGAAEVWWTHDGAAVLEGPQAVELGEVLRVVEADFSQRQDKVGPGNPHGEHAHDVFLPLVPLAPGVYTGLEQ